jgi:hypothetical protein
VASKPITTLINLKTGQPAFAFAFAAIDWNVSWSMPGILAVTVRWTDGKAVPIRFDDDVRIAIHPLRHEV